MVVAVDTEALSENKPEGDDRVAAHLTCHVAIFTIMDGELSLLLTERNQGPFRFQWELPGLTPQPEEELEIAARRSYIALLNTNSAVEIHQLGAYGDPARDPRHRAVAVVYWGVVNDTELGEALRNKPSEIRLIPFSESTSDGFRFAFDHARIATDALNALRRSLAHTSTATRLCKAEFTISDLLHIYEVVFDTKVSAGNFHRKVLNTPGFVEPVGEQPRNPKKKGRPAQYFRAPDLAEVLPPFDFKSGR